MKYPDHTDERAYEFFAHVYTGKNEYRFDTSYDGDIATTYIKIGRSQVCAYCGNGCYPLQRGLSKYKYDLHTETPKSAYKTTGYACVCKDACDERDVKESIKKEKERYQQEVQQIKETGPKINIDVIKRERLKSMEKAIKEIKDKPESELFFNRDAGVFEIIEP